MNKINERKLSGEVVKTNNFNLAIHNLTLVELRIIQLAIADSRDTQQGLTPYNPLLISAQRYAECFGVEDHTAYEVMQEAEKRLFERRFTFINDSGNEVKSRWVSQVEYCNGGISIILTPAVVAEITRIDGYETAFTKYYIQQCSGLGSVYSLRLYELLKQWTKTKSVALELNLLRGQLGIEDDEYQRMSDFKKRVLDVAVDEINEKTDLKISYENIKKGVKIVGFQFKILEKPKEKDIGSKRDQDTIDMFTEMSDKQINYFSHKLANDVAFGGQYAKPGETTQAFEQRIKQELNNAEMQKKWKEHLKRVGFKQ